METQEQQVESLFKVNNNATTTTSMTCSGVFIVNFERISHTVIEFLLLTLSR